MKTLSTLLALVMFFPVPLLAQATSTEPQISTTEEVVDVVDPTPPIEIPVEIIQASTPEPDATTTTITEPAQSTTSTQEAVQGTTLEQTLDPQGGNSQPEASTTEVIIVETATSTEPVSNPTPNPVGGQSTSTPPASSTPSISTTTPPTSNPVTIPEPVIQPVQVIAPVPVVVPPPVMQVTQEELEPEKEYKIALDGRAIATTINDDNPKTKDKMVTDVPVTSLDVKESVLDVSGQCTDPYFVILLYKNEGDYDANPASYILNKAFDCVNGRYSYSVSELPKDLADGRYFLLVGGQGTTGSWKPASALVPITLNRNDN